MFSSRTTRTHNSTPDRSQVTQSHRTSESPNKLFLTCGRSKVYAEWAGCANPNIRQARLEENGFSPRIGNTLLWCKHCFASYAPPNVRWNNKRKPRSFCAVHICTSQMRCSRRFDVFSSWINVMCAYMFNSDTGEHVLFYKHRGIEIGLYLALLHVRAPLAPL